MCCADDEAVAMETGYGGTGRGLPRSAPCCPIGDAGASGIGCTRAPLWPPHARHRDMLQPQPEPMPEGRAVLWEGVIRGAV